MIILIAAVNQAQTIGLEGKMPWHVPEDLKHFRATTLNQTLLMGRKTFEGLPKKLDQRQIYVTSRFDHDGIEHCVHDLQAFLASWRTCDQDLYVAGGGEVYKQSMPFADKILISRIHNDLVGDTFFPEIDASHFQLTQTELKETFTLEIYERIV